MGTGSRVWSFPRDFPASNDVPVLLLNQPNEINARGKNDKRRGREEATENLNASVTKEIAVNPSLFGSYSLAVRKKTETGLLNLSHVYVYVYVYVYAPESKAVLMLSITLVICLLNIW